MEIYVIVCKLHAKHVYDGFFESVKALGDAWWHCSEPTWLVRSSLNPQQIKTRLSRHLQADDHLLVLACKDKGVWEGFSDIPAMWLKTIFKPQTLARSRRQSPDYAAE